MPDTDDESRDLPLVSDSPIEHEAQDLLQRRGLATRIAHQLLTLPSERGFVLGVTGEWGSGKSSTLNLVERALASSDVEVIRFNPWLLASSEQLVSDFFNQLALDLRLRGPRLRRIAQRMADYSQALNALESVPAVGMWIRIGAVIARLFGRSASLEQQKEQLSNAILASGLRLAVFIDDIDRLEDDEVREMLRLVRLVGNFPNTIYVVAFDPERIEKAFDDPQDGRSYIEKIVQISYPVPESGQGALLDATFRMVDQAIEDVDHGELHEEAWPDIALHIVSPLVGTLRDAKRLALGVRLSADAVGPEVCLEDLIALEAVRILAPQLFASVVRNRDGLTSVRSHGFGRQDPRTDRLDAQAQAVLEDAKAHGKANLAKSLIELVFPAAGGAIGGMSYGADWRGRWRTDQRVAHSDVLDIYLRRVLPEGELSLALVERIVSALSRPEDLRSILGELSAEEKGRVLDRLEDYEGEFDPGVVVPAVSVVLDLVGAVPAGKGGLLMGGLRPGLRVTRVALRLMRAIDDEQELETAVSRIMNEVRSLTGKFHLALMVGYTENAGHELVSEACASDLQAEFTTAVARSDPETIRREADALGVVDRAMRWANEEQREALTGLLRDDRVLVGMLRGGMSEAQSGALGSAYVRTEMRLPWQSLSSLVGEDALITRVRRLPQDSSDWSDEEMRAIDLAVQYADGWRPESL